MIGKLILRTSAAVRHNINTHEFMMGRDKEYRANFEAYVKMLNFYNIDKHVPNYVNHFTPIKMEDISTGEVLNFKSKAEAARHLKCSATLISYYKDKGIKEFLGFKLL